MSDEITKIILGDTAISAGEGSSPPEWEFRWRKKKKLREPLTNCENCGAPLDGHYCGKCGQPAIDYRRSFGHVVVDVLNEFLNWDSKFFATIALLIVKPWRLTNEFLAGHRVRYVHPLRLYLLASIAFFFAATYSIKSVHFNPINLSPRGRAEVRSELERENLPPDIRARVQAALTGKAISEKKRAILEAKLKNEHLPQEVRDSIQERLEHGDMPDNARTAIDEMMKDLPPEARGKVDSAIHKAINQPVIFETENSDKPNDIPKWLQKRAKEKFGEHGTNVQLFLVTLVSNLPYMMLVCIPLFAFVLKILYIRRRIFYIDHLIYALHIHTFAYIAVMFSILATIAVNTYIGGALGGWVIALIWVLVAIQIFLSIRRVYRQGWFFTVFKFLAGGFAYLIVLCCAIAATFFITLALP